LTIKLTQHVPTSSGPSNQVNEGLASPRFFVFKGTYARLVSQKSDSKRARKRREEASSPFHKRYSRAKICGLSRYTDLEIRITRCLLPSVVKDRRSAQQFPIGTSPLPAERGIGLEPMPRNQLETK